MIKSSYEVEVLVNGRPLKEYLHQDKLFIEGKEGSKFSLRFRNNSAERKLFTPSIDGLSIMDGKEAHFDSSGYIVHPYSTLTIDGWRTSDKEVAQFFFSSPGKSYAKRKGKGQNIGVIGCAVFGEKRQPKYIDHRDYLPDIFPNQPPLPKRWPFDDMPRWLSTSGLPSQNLLNQSETKWESSSLSIDSGGQVNAMYSNSDGVKKSYSNQALGTGWGDQKRSEVTTVTFEREDSPREVFTALYNSREELEKMGITFAKEPVYVSPSAFPAETQYCEPPRN